MARLVLSPRALTDLERLTESLMQRDRKAAADTLPLLKRGLAILKEHPLIGRQAEAGLRELVISRGRTG